MRVILEDYKGFRKELHGKEWCEALERRHWKMFEPRRFTALDLDLNGVPVSELVETQLVFVFDYREVSDTGEAAIFKQV